MGIELPNGKISRTLPEQVGENTRRLSVLENYQLESFYIEDGILYAKRVSGEVISLGSITGVSDITLQAGHLIFTLNNGSTIDAGLVRGITNTSIDGNQHLIITYSDGTSQDLGAIFTGNINISGTINATSITGDSIIETMTGYSFVPATSYAGLTYDYAGACKNGNKLTLVIAGKIVKVSGGSYNIGLGDFYLPLDIANKIFPNSLGILDRKNVLMYDTEAGTSNVKQVPVSINKSANGRLYVQAYGIGDTSFPSVAMYFRWECTFLLSDNLAA